MTLLTVKNLKVKLAEIVLNGVNLVVEAGSIVGIRGANGSGKSTLAMTLLGSEHCEILEGQILFEGRDLLEMKIEERAREGLYVTWQMPLTVPGVSVFNLAKASYVARGREIPNLVEFKNEIEKYLTMVGLPKEYVRRGVNEEMSGGERKRLELMFILLLKPRLIVLDEIDSGLDEAGREMVIRIVKKLSRAGHAFIVISHYGEFLKQIGMTRIWTMSKGKLLQYEEK